LAATSRHAFRRHHAPPPERGVDEFVRAINRAVAEEGYEVVLPSEDAQVLALSARRDEIDAVTPYGPHGGVRAASDKTMIAEAAAAAGLSTPRIWLPEEPEWRTWHGPLVVKARVHPNLERTDAPAHLDPLLVMRIDDALQHVERIRSLGGEPVIQEAVEGVLMAYSAVLDSDGRAAAEAQQRAAVIWPPGQGISVRAVTVAVDADLAERIQVMLRTFQWFGLAEVQMIAPPRGAPSVIDVNGRLYGSIALAIAAGANLPAAWAALATGRQPPPRCVARLGVRYHWLEGDFRQAFARRDRRGAEVLAALRWAPGAVHSIARRDDPLPALRYAAVLAGRAVRKGLTAARGARRAPRTSETSRPHA
jgi:ATP-grasp in the biosynthetic pathway with Ter operon